MNKLLFFILILSLFVSCSYDEQLTPIDVDVASTNLYPYQKIIERANHYYGQLPGKTRSSMPYVISAEPIGYSNTRSDKKNVPVYYLVNYENESGFVIVGANDFADPMVAISDEGNISMSDTIENKTLAAFINVITTPELNAPIDTVTIPNPLPENVTVEPLLDARVRKWGQRAPFNSSIPFVFDGEKAPVGCHPLACAMYMSYFNHPSNHNGRTLNWNNIIKNYYDGDLAYILWDLGSEKNLNVQYTASGTGTYSSQLRQTFENYNYSFPSSAIRLSSFDFSSKFKVMNQLPMYIYGSGYYNDEPTGHAWIIDGVLHLQNPKDIITGDLANEYYFHCVWGWYGKGNGYFKKDKVNKIGGERYAPDGTDGTYPGIQDTNEVPTWDIMVTGLWGIRPGGAMIRPGL